MATADGDGRRLAAARATALRMAAAKATVAGGSERGQSASERAAAWGALVFGGYLAAPEAASGTAAAQETAAGGSEGSQQQRGRRSWGVWFLDI